MASSSRSKTQADKIKKAKAQTRSITKPSKKVTFAKMKSTKKIALKKTPPKLIQKQKKSADPAKKIKEAAR